MVTVMHILLGPFSRLNQSDKLKPYLVSLGTDYLLKGKDWHGGLLGNGH